MKTHILTLKMKQSTNATFGSPGTPSKSGNLTGIKFIVLLGLTTFAANAEHGKKIYESKCGGCHDTRVHTRPNRIVHTYEDLVNRVRFCDANAKTSFTESDILDVSEYLNNEFYKFLKMDH